MERELISYIQADLPHKIVLLMGPRQCGKTTLAKLISNNFDYLNYDADEDRLILKQKSWDRDKEIVIFDELHKMRNWKRWLKGIYDTEGIPPQLLVTGSARLDVHRKVGDSLAGRFFQYRLHPLDLKEAHKFYGGDSKVLFDTLWHCSGFPEPFLRADPEYYRRWRRSHLDIILRQDLIDLHSVRDIKAIENLVLLLRQRVGGSVSYANLARDLERDPHTIKRWLQLLENLHIIFKVKPYSKKIARTLLKEPKYYFYDFSYVEDDGARLENLVACALFKELHLIEDTKGLDTGLYYLRTKDGKELDFLITFDNVPTHIIEVKNADANPSPAFTHFSKFFIPEITKLQLVKKLSRNQSYDNGIKIKQLIPWLEQLDLYDKTKQS